MKLKIQKYEIEKYKNTKKLKYEIINTKLQNRNILKY